MNTTPSSNRVDDLMLEVIEMQNKSTDAHVSLYDKDPEWHETSKDRSESDTENDDSMNNESDDGIPRTCLLRTAIFLIISAILFSILFATGLLRNEDLSGIPVLGNVDFEGFFDTDPFGGEVTPETPETAYRWTSPQQSGLELSILNALTDDWQQEFETALAQWETGTPDTLTLQSQRVEVDAKCEPVNGVLKVCNGDYGATDWLGINVLLLDMEGKWIHSSTAKMNEHFLARASPAQRQYTMCHELGHGFGLPHWDVNFYNANIGNCMDYTNRPKTNQQPDKSNFDFLKQLYGEIGATQQPVAGAPSSQQDPSVGWSSNPPPQQENNQENNEEEENESEGNDRSLRRTVSHRRSQDIPATVMSIYRSVLNGEALPTINSHRILHADDGQNDGILIDLGFENYGLLVYKLRAGDSNEG